MWLLNWHHAILACRLRLTGLKWVTHAGACCVAAASLSGAKLQCRKRQTGASPFSQLQALPPCCAGCQPPWEGRCPHARCCTDCTRSEDVDTMGCRQRCPAVLHGRHLGNSLACGVLSQSRHPSADCFEDSKSQEPPLEVVLVHALLLEELVVGPLLHLGALPGLAILLSEALHAVGQLQFQWSPTDILVQSLKSFTRASSTASFTRIKGRLLNHPSPKPLGAGNH